MFGKKLKEIRTNLKLTQDAFAKELSISARTYTAYERDENKPSYFMLETLGNKFNINLNWFILNKGDMFNSPQYDTVKNELRQEVLQILKDEGIIK